MVQESIDGLILTSSEKNKFILSDAEVAKLNLLADGHIKFLKIPVAKRREDFGRANFMENVTIELILYASLALFATNFLGGFLKEAGVDLYKYTKKTVSSKDEPESGSAKILALLTDLVSRNESISYHVGQKIQICLPVNKEHVIIQLYVGSMDLEKMNGWQAVQLRHRQALSSAQNEEQVSQACAEHKLAIMPFVEQYISQQLCSLAESWEKITDDVERFKVGESSLGRSASGFHLIRRSELGWHIRAFESEEFDWKKFDI